MARVGRDGDLLDSAIAAATRASNRRQQEEPSRDWAITRTFGEECNNRLRAELVAWLQLRGHAAVAPVLHPEWGGVEVAGSGPASNWSERHAAYAAGLGTFSLNDALITAAGMAHRCGSVVTSLNLPADPRPYAGVRDWCLFHARGTCAVCVKRCPVGAISVSDHDKLRCRDYTYGTLQPRLKERYGVAMREQFLEPCSMVIGDREMRSATTIAAAQCDGCLPKMLFERCPAGAGIAMELHQCLG